jgi:hypothetical protein
VPAPPDLEALRAAVAGGQRFDYRFFWGHRAARSGGVSDACFSQWWHCHFVVDRQPYLTAEQWMMASKARLFADGAIAASIVATADPREVKALGRCVRGFDEARWAAARFDIVTRGNIAKFGQNPELRAHLMSTGDAVLVEASPTDGIWGIGLARSDPDAADPRRWRGLNLLGFALVRARGVLRGELPPPV